MILNVTQTIVIHVLRVNSVTNSSILQVGSAGMIKGLSNNFNTGCFTGPAPEAKPSGAGSGAGASSAFSTAGSTFPLVPLPSLQ